MIDQFVPLGLFGQVTHDVKFWQGIFLMDSIGVGFDFLEI